MCFVYKSDYSSYAQLYQSMHHENSEDLIKKWKVEWMLFIELMMVVDDSGVIFIADSNETTLESDE